jgi:glutathione S-transferase
MIKLFGHPDSGHAFKVRFFMQAAGIEHNYQEIDIWSPRESRPAEFRRNAKFQEVPLLIDNGQPYIQSNAILIYLATKIGDYGAQESLLMSRCYEWLVWEANKIGMCLPQLRSVKKFENHGINEGAQNWLLDRYHHDITVLETELDDGRAFILGPRPTIADFSLSGYLFFDGEADVAVPPNVVKWLDRLAALPAWRHPYELLKESPE